MADQVYGALHADIVEGRLKAGEKLPIEPQLALAFGVSRTVIREAVGRLRNDGLVVSKQGAGVFVAARPINQAFRMAPNAMDNAESIREIFELRLGIEVEAAGLAALRRVSDQLVRIEKALQGIEATKRGPDLGVEADAEFHRAIALASGNSKIASFQRYLSVFLVQSITAARTHTWKMAPGMVDEVVGEHETILAALKLMDQEMARAAMRTHLVNAQNRLGLVTPEFAQQMRRLR